MTKTASAPLSNPRHEAFVQAHVEGLPAYAAYLQAGYKCTVRTAEVESSKLLKKPEIRNRRRQLLEDLAETLIVTKESLYQEYEQARALAHEQGQAAAAINAIAAKSRLFGLDAPNVNVNINTAFNQMTEDELRFELASMVNAVRAAKGQPLLELPPKKGETKH